MIPILYNYLLSCATLKMVMEVLNILCTKIVEGISQSSSIDYSQNDKEKMIFTLEVFLGDVSKSIILLAVFAALGYGPFYIVGFLVTVFLRTNMGGFDFDGYLKCLMFSFVYYSGLLLVFVSQWDLSWWFMPIVAACMVVQWLIAPVVNLQREQVKGLKRKLLRNRTLALTGIVVFMHIIINNPYTLLGLWIVVIQTLFILIYKGAKYYEKNSQHIS